MGVCHIVSDYFLRNGAGGHTFPAGRFPAFCGGSYCRTADMPLEVNVLALILFVAAVLGDSCNYMIGHFFGQRLFNNPDSRIFKQSHLDKTHEFYKKYGGKTIIIARFVPIVRTFAPFVAGMGKMHYYYFMLYNLIGAPAGLPSSVMRVISSVTFRLYKRTSTD